jgi:hypothetical protein
MDECIQVRPTEDKRTREPQVWLIGDQVILNQGSSGGPPRPVLFQHGKTVRRSGASTSRGIGTSRAVFENSSEREIGFRRRFLLAFSFTSSSFSILSPSPISSSISFSFFSSSSSSSYSLGSSTSSLSRISLFFLSKGGGRGMGESSNSRVGTPGITTCRTKRLHQLVRLTSSPV